MTLLQEAFYNFDEDKDFLLHIDDLRKIVGEDGEPLDPQDLQDFLDECMNFADNDGYVDYRNLAAMMLSA